VESLGLALLQLFPQQDIGFGLVGEDEPNFGFVLRVFLYGSGVWRCVNVCGENEVKKW
jgi:hypothetical protein